VPLEVSTRVLEGSQPSFCPYSSNLVEEEFCEVRGSKLALVGEGVDYSTGRGSGLYN
jgi:hypothetical protein